MFTVTGVPARIGRDSLGLCWAILYSLAACSMYGGMKKAVDWAASNVATSAVVRCIMVLDQSQWIWNSKQYIDSRQR